MKTSLVIFDLDGTLLDTIGDLAVACNAVLGVRGLPQHTYEEYCHFVGNGILRLVERALPEPLRTPETVAAVRADFVKYYTEHIDAHTRPYDGIPELIAELARRGVEQVPGRDREARRAVLPRGDVRRGAGPASRRAAETFAGGRRGDSRTDGHGA